MQEDKEMFNSYGLNEKSFLPLTSRQLLKQIPEAIGYEDEDYLCMFDTYQRVAIYNNLLANKWASGFVPMVHYQSLNSRTCPVISDILTSKIVGNIDIEGEGDNLVKELKDSLINFQNTITQMESDVLNRGEAVITTNLVEEQGKVSFEVYPLGRYILKIDQDKTIYDALLFKRIFDTKDKFTNFVLAEHRFYKVRKGEKIPFIEYTIIRNAWSTRVGLTREVERQAINAEQIPKEILAQLGEIEINKAKELKTLGVYRFKNTATNKLARYSDIGESQFINATGFMMALENSMTYQEIDKNIGRGRVLTPTMSSVGNGLGLSRMPRQRKETILDYTFMTPYTAEVGSLDQKMPLQSVQFQLRADEWKISLEQAEAKVCIRCGISVLDFDPTLAGTTERTATETNYLSDITANTVKAKRALIHEELDKLVNDLAIELGLNDLKVFVVFDKSTILNQIQNQSLILQQYQQGLCSLKTAIKSLHPEWNDEEVEAEIERIELERNSASVASGFDTMFGTSSN